MNFLILNVENKIPYQEIIKTARKNENKPVYEIEQTQGYD